MPSNHLILCCPLLLLPSIFPTIRVFSNESALRIRWPKDCSFSFNISPSNEHPRLISFRMDWLDLLAVQTTLKSLLQHHSSKTSILLQSAFFIVQLSWSDKWVLSPREKEEQRSADVVLKVEPGNLACAGQRRLSTRSAGLPCVDTGFWPLCSVSRGALRFPGSKMSQLDLVLTSFSLLRICPSTTVEWWCLLVTGLCIYGWLKKHLLEELTSQHTNG